MSFESLFKKLREAVDESPKEAAKNEKNVPESENTEAIASVSPKGPELDHRRAWEREQEEKEDRFEELREPGSGK